MSKNLLVSIVVVLLLFKCIVVNATIQFKDFLIIGKDTVAIDSPIDLLSDIKFQNYWYSKILKPHCQNSGCWRGAICSWTLKDDSLFFN